jgi:hypothetical protein
MKHIPTKILLYILALIHLPWTLIRVLVSFTLLVDAWCDKTINNFLKENAKD